MHFQEPILLINAFPTSPVNRHSKFPMLIQAMFFLHKFRDDEEL
jgi:hypothetical protein